MLNDQSWETDSISWRSGLDVSLVETSHEILLGYERDGGTTGEVVLNVHANLGSVSNVSLSLDAGTANGGAYSDDTSMDSA